MSGAAGLVIAPTTPDPRRRLIFAIVLLGQFVIVASTASVNVALAAIQQDLRASAEQIQWIALVNQLAFAAVLVTGGRLGDMFGHRRVSWRGWWAWSRGCSSASPPRRPGPSSRRA